MAKNDSDLFDRLRQAGLRKQAAQTLSGIGEGASKKALRAARSAISELRSLADELERRLPGSTPDASATGKSAEGTATRSPAATPRVTRSRADRKTAAARQVSNVRAPRGQNKAKILGSLKAGPKTASEIAKETGIGSGTVGSTLSKLATAGEVVKADRGYRLPN
jgi:Bacterial regulatory protein, arsR family